MMEIKENNIVYVNYGLGNVIQGKIYLHKDLKENPELQMTVLKHELKHIDECEHVDLNEPWNWDIFKFCIKRPSTWVQLFPIWIIRNKIIYSKNMIMAWLFLVFWIMLMYGVYLWQT